MRTIFGILLIIYFSIFSCSKSKSSSEKKNDASEFGLNGKVKSVKSEIYSLIPEKDTFRIGEKVNGMSEDRNSLMQFNQQGNLTSSMEFLYNGKVSNQAIYTYDEKERLTKRKEIDNYGKGSFLDYEFIYNSQDSVTQTTISDNSFKRIYKIERDEKNRAIKSEATQNDTVVLIYILKYDQNGNVIVENEFRKKDVPIKIVERTFNKENLKEKEQVVEYNTWDTLSYENRFFYNKNKNLILEKDYIENDSNYTENKYSYHNNGEIKEHIITPVGSRRFVILTQKFNKNGDRIELSRTPSDNKPKEVWNNRFKYDSNNNWIEKLEFKDNRPLYIVKRTIEYYN